MIGINEAIKRAKENVHPGDVIKIWVGLDQGKKPKHIKVMVVKAYENHLLCRRLFKTTMPLESFLWDDVAKGTKVFKKKEVARVPQNRKHTNVSYERTMFAM